MEDINIIELYFNRNERAIAETAAKYGAYLHTIAYNILHSSEDSEECTSDTYMKAWNAIPPQRPNILKAFLGRITRNLALNIYQRYTAQKRGGTQTETALDELSDIIASPEKESDSEDIKNCINRFLGELPADQRKIFVLRYWYMSAVSDIAKDFKFSESKVKMTLKRTRDKLKEALLKEGIYI